MDEASARRVVLLRAIETAPPARDAWSVEDRDWASRVAAEYEGADAPADVFVARRARHAVERLGERHPTLPRLLRAFAWRGWVAPLLALVAFLVGMAIDRIGPGRRVDLLTIPLIGLVAWNLAVYAWLVLGSLVGMAGRLGGGQRVRRPGMGAGLRGLVAWLAHAAPRAVPRALRRGPLADPTAAFVADWSRLAAPLWRTRVASALHLSAAMLAAGTVAGMYLRGLVLDYTAGWESTFWDAETVRRVLEVVLGPASALTGIALPDAVRLEAMRVGPGESAAPWIHLWATTLGALVVAPRLLLWALLAAIARWRSARFPLSLDTPYFGALLRRFGDVPALVEVLPYSFSPTPAAQAGLRELLARALGPGMELRLAPAVAYGAVGPNDESGPRPGARPVAGAGIAAATAGAVRLALFAMTATPEKESHGEFLESVAARGGVTAALVDTSAFRQRFGDQPQRVDARRAAWAELLESHRVPVVFADLEAPPDQTALASLQAALSGGTVLVPVAARGQVGEGTGAATAGARPAWGNPGAGR